MITYTIIYEEDGEKKKRSWKMDGKPTGKKWKEFQTEMASKASDIFHKDGCEFLMSVWVGAGKKQGGQR